MEIYGFYNSATTVSEFFVENIPHTKIWGIAIAVALWLVLFVLQGVGLATMAKRRNINGRWRAFCPFVNLYFIGKLVGECSVFGQRVKRAGLYTMIVQIIATLYCGALIAAEIYLYNVCGMPTKITLADNPFYFVLDWENLTGFSAVVENFYATSDYILLIIELVYIIFVHLLLIGLYKKYAPKNYMPLGLLSLFVPASRFIIAFVLRNRKAIDYDAYMRAKREAYMRQRQQYGGYGNPYGGYGQNPYGNPYGSPYGQPQPPQQPQKPEDPFEEFSSDTKNTGDANTGENTGGDSDGFFD